MLEGALGPLTERLVDEGLGGWVSLGFSVEGRAQDATSSQIRTIKHHSAYKLRNMHYGK